MKPIKPTTDWDTYMQEYLNGPGKQRIENITDYSDRKLEEGIDKADDGLPIAAIAAVALPIVAGFIETRVNVTADNEANPAVAAASQIAAASILPNGSKEWICMFQNSRDEHMDADGQVVPIDEPYDVGGEELMYPGDPDGSDWNIINCQCEEDFQSEGAD